MCPSTERSLASLAASAHSVKQARSSSKRALGAQPKSHLCRYHRASTAIASRQGWGKLLALIALHLCNALSLLAHSANSACQGSLISPDQGQQLSCRQVAYYLGLYLVEENSSAILHVTLGIFLSWQYSSTALAVALSETTKQWACTATGVNFLPMKRLGAKSNCVDYWG